MHVSKAPLGSVSGCLPLSVVATVAFVCLGAASPSLGQTNWQLGIGGIAGIPTGSLQSEISGVQGGFAFYLTRRLKATPFRLGLEVGMMPNGGVDVPVLVDGETEEGTLGNSIWFGHVMGRLQPTLGRWSPYVEGLIGTKEFITSVSRKDAGLLTPDEKLLSRHALSLGVGSGASLCFHRAKREGRSDRTTSLDVAARFLSGGEAEYFLPSDLPAIAAGQGVAPRRSRTSLLMISFGVLVEF